MLLYAVLQTLSDGKIIRKGVAMALQILGVVVLVGGAYLLIEILKAALQLPTDATVGGLLFAGIFLATVLSIARMTWYRAATVRELGDTPFCVIPIVSILLRTIGEAYAALGVAVGFGGCLFLWFAKTNPLGLLQGLGAILPSTSVEVSFMGGISFLLYSTVISFFGLIFFYFLSESVVVLVDVVRHGRLLVRQGAPGQSTQAGDRRPKCAAELEPEARKEVSVVE